MRADPTPLPLVLDRVGYRDGGATLLDDVSLRLEAGPRTVILGPNGAGKSLLLRLCHGLLRPSTGRLAWDGPAAASAAVPLGNGRACHALLFQRPVLLRRSALANVVHALALAGIRPRRLRRERALAALTRFGLDRIADRPARALSGGEQQRLALARIWPLRPAVLFLDEPTAALDPAATRAIEEMVLAFDREGTKIVMTTHDLGQARRIADEIVFLHRGRLIEGSAAANFFAGPATPEAAAFLRGELIAW